MLIVYLKQRWVLLSLPAPNLNNLFFNICASCLGLPGCAICLRSRDQISSCDSSSSACGQGLQTVTLESGINHQEAICTPTHLHLPHHLMWLDTWSVWCPWQLWTSSESVSCSWLPWTSGSFCSPLLPWTSGSIWSFSFHISLTHQLHLLIRNINYIHSCQTTLKNLDKVILGSP